MRHDTAMSAAIARAGGPTIAEARFNVAIAEFQNNGGTLERAMELVCGAYRSGECGGHVAGDSHQKIAAGSPENHPDAGGRSAIDDQFARATGVGSNSDDAFRQTVNASLAVTAGASSGTYSDAVGQLAVDAHSRCAAGVGTNSDGGESQTHDDTQRLGAPPSSDPQSADRGHSSGDAPRNPVAVARKLPGHPRRGLVAIASVQSTIGKTIMDTFRVRDGRPIGDIAFGEMERLRSANSREASLFRQIQNHAANVSPLAKVREVIKVELLQQMIQRAAEVADAG